MGSLYRTVITGDLTIGSSFSNEFSYLYRFKNNKLDKTKIKKILDNKLNSA